MTIKLKANGPDALRAYTLESTEGIFPVECFFILFTGKRKEGAASAVLLDPGRGTRVGVSREDVASAIAYLEAEGHRVEWAFDIGEKVTWHTGSIEMTGLFMETLEGGEARIMTLTNDGRPMNLKTVVPPTVTIFPASL